MQIDKEIIARLAGAESIAILTGAGVSAESGISTFRDKDGYWSKYNPMELASPRGFSSDPDLVWQWYQHRRRTLSKASPNPGHYAIAEMQNIWPGFTLITQNVDRLHQRAGSTDVIELHGNIIENHCFSCGRKHLHDVDMDSTSPDKCEYCGGLVRPSVVWFGEGLPEDAIRLANEAAQSCDVFFSIGTSAEVYPAGMLPLHARDRGAFVIEINKGRTVITNSVDAFLQGPSGEILPELIEQVKQYRT